MSQKVIDKQTSNNNEITISVIIVNYKTSELIVNAIDSIYKKTTDVSFEIIVVDNNSNDDSGKILHKKYSGQIRFISLTENLGFGKANNEGAKIAKGKYLFFLNPDTILINNAIKILTHFLEHNQYAGACGGNLYTENLLPTHSCMPMLPSVLLELDSLLGHLPFKIRWGNKFDFNTSGKPRKVADIIGADLMIKSDLFRKLGGFDPDFFLYMEETELAYRIHKNGFSIYSVSEAKIIHLEGKSSDSEITGRKYALVSRKIYYRKTQNYANRVLIDLIFSTKCIIGILWSAVTLKKNYINYWYSALKNGIIELW